MTVRFRGLCADAAAPALVARFWADLLGHEAEILPDGDAVVRSGGATWLWVNRVPEAKAVKNRVHLDVYAPDRHIPGGTLLAALPGWSVWADPEGNEFCAFDPPDADPRPRAFAVCTDSADPVPLAAWWAERTGARLGPGPDGTLRWLTEVPGLDLIWKFVAVDDPRTVKNRWHWDVVGHEVPGATLVQEYPRWAVHTDPDGNEFCLFTP